MSGALIGGVAPYALLNIGDANNYYYHGQDDISNLYSSVRSRSGRITEIPPSYFSLQLSYFDEQRIKTKVIRNR